MGVRGFSPLKVGGQNRVWQAIFGWCVDFDVDLLSPQKHRFQSRHSPQQNPPQNPPPLQMPCGRPKLSPLKKSAAKSSTKIHTQNDLTTQGPCVCMPGLSHLASSASRVEGPGVRGLCEAMYVPAATLPLWCTCFAATGSHLQGWLEQAPS